MTIKELIAELEKIPLQYRNQEVTIELDYGQVTGLANIFHDTGNNYSFISNVYYEFDD